MTEIKRINSAEFLIESGLLFEINRRLLHPMGLALEAVIEVDGTFRLGDLWNYMDDPEGMLYEPVTFQDGMAKLENFMRRFGLEKLAERKKNLGFVVQTTPYVEGVTPNE